MLIKSLLSKSVETLLQEAVHAELYAAHLYRHVANQSQKLGYFGAHKHFLAASSEETEHYQKHAEYLNDSGSVAKLPAIEAIDEAVMSLSDALEIAYETELQLGKDYERWFKESDPTTQQHLLTFLAEQRESVGQYADWLARLARAGSNEAAILIIDTELGA